MTTTSIRLPPSGITKHTRVAAPAKPAGGQPASPPAPTVAEVRAALQKLAGTVRDGFASIARSSATPGPDTDVVMARGIASGQARSLGLGDTTDAKGKTKGIATAAAGGSADNPGHASLDTKLANNPSLASVKVGTLTINGQSIKVNPNRDTLASVVASVDAFTGVSASIDAHSGLVTINTERRGDSLEISDSSGLIAALGIRTGTTKAVVAERRTQGPRPGASAAANAVDQAVGQVNAVLDTLARARDLSASFRTDIVSAVRGAVAGVAGAAHAGLRFAPVDGKETLVVDGAALWRTLTKDPHALDALLSGAQGLASAIDAVLTRHGAPEAAPAPVAAPRSTILDGRRLTRSTAAIADGATPLLRVELLAPPLATRRFDVLA